MLELSLNAWMELARQTEGGDGPSLGDEKELDPFQELTEGQLGGPRGKWESSRQRAAWSAVWLEGSGAWREKRTVYFEDKILNT